MSVLVSPIFMCCLSPGSPAGSWQLAAAERHQECGKSKLSLVTRELNSKGSVRNDYLECCTGLFILFQVSFADIQGLSITVSM